MLLTWWAWGTKHLVFGLVGTSLSIVQFTQKFPVFKVLSLLLKSKLFCNLMTFTILKSQKSGKLVYNFEV